MKLAPWLILTAITVSSGTALGDDPANHMSTDEKGDAVWSLNSYLRGTTPQICQRINGEFDRLAAAARHTQAEIDELNATINKKSDKALKAVRATAEYQDLVAQRDAAEAAKKDAHGQDLLDASSRANRAREAITKLENDAIDQAAHSDRDDLAKLQADLARHHAALAKAKAWRDNLVDSMRTTFLIDGPVRVGERGILGKVSVERVIDARSFVIRYNALEVIGVKDAGEGTEEIKTRSHKTMLVLSETGIDTSKLAHDDELLLDRDFEISDTIVAGDSKDSVFLARPAPAPVDDLMKAVDADNDAIR